MKRNISTQELINIYPTWSRVRHEQSNGYMLLNVFANKFDHLDTFLDKMIKNQYLSTTNLDEIDLLHKAKLSLDFNFSVSTGDISRTTYITPTVSGLVDSTWYPIAIAEDNNLEYMWYDTCPNRTSLETIVSGVDHNLLTFSTTSGLSLTGTWSHHLGGGHLWIEAQSGIQYYHINDDSLDRGRIVLHGKTRQGLYESETLVFPWDMKQRTIKEWEFVDKIVYSDIEESVNIVMTSANFNSADYLSLQNFRYSPARTKIDEYWSLSNTVSGSILERINYVTDDWKQLLHGHIEKEIVESWELLDNSENPITAVDMALQPFTNRAWMATTSGLLHCYSTDQSMIKGVEYLRERTDGSHVLIDIEPRYVLLGEDIEFIPWYAKPTQEILRYRLWYQKPSGAKYGLLNGTSVSFTDDLWVTSKKLERTIANLVILPANERGEYLLVLEVEFTDHVIHTDRVIVSVNYKTPEVSLDISDSVSGLITGIDFDSDQQLWVKTDTEYYHINFHSDVMLIDYQQKIIYFKEPYDQVEVIP